jgi:hypothetical protein
MHSALKLSIAEPIPFPHPRVKFLERLIFDSFAAINQVEESNRACAQVADPIVNQARLLDQFEFATLDCL